MAKEFKRLNDGSIKFIKSTDCNQVNNSYKGCASLAEELSKFLIFMQAWTLAKGLCKTLEKDETDESVAKSCWTIDEPNFYKIVNQELRDWHFNKRPNKEFPFNNYVKLLEGQCEKLPSIMTLYRGIDHKDLPLINQGEHLTSPCMYSCSVNKETAIKFTKRVGTLMIIETQYAINIGDYSKYPGEHEYLIPPGMYFKVSLHHKDPNGYDIIHMRLVEVKIVPKTRPDLALDMSEHFLKLQAFTPDTVKQKWFFQGRYIRNISDGKVIDINYRNINEDKNIPEGTNLVTWRLHCKQNQEWFHNGHFIESGIEGYVMHVNGNVEIGDDIVVKPKEQSDNQLFSIEFI